MSSGHGLRGGPSRCFSEFQRYIECYTSASTESPSQCTAKVDDYFECLHHRKERFKIQTIKTELANQQAKGNAELSTVNVKKSLPETLGLVE